jgi:hypothetical protein
MIHWKTLGFRNKIFCFLFFIYPYFLINHYAMVYTCNTSPPRSSSLSSGFIHTAYYRRRHASTTDSLELFGVRRVSSHDFPFLASLFF